MPRYLAFLHGINLGKRRIKMPALKALFEQLPVHDVATFIASGNVIFTARQPDVARLENQISIHLEAALGYAVGVTVRTTAELAKIVAEAPLGDLWTDSPAARTQISLHARPIAPADADILHACRTPIDAFAVTDREIHWRCAGKMTDSTVWKTSELKALRLPPGTMRNLNTLTKLTALYPP